MDTGGFTGSRICLSSHSTRLCEHFRSSRRNRVERSPAPVAIGLGPKVQGNSREWSLGVTRREWRAGRAYIASVFKRLQKIVSPQNSFPRVHTADFSWWWVG